MKLKITPSEAQAILWGKSPDWEKVEVTEQGKTGRWTVGYSGVFRRKSDGKLFGMDWDEGATEHQDQRPFEYDSEVEMYEVEAKEVTVVQYIPVKAGA